MLMCKLWRHSSAWIDLGIRARRMHRLLGSPCTPQVMRTHGNPDEWDAQGHCNDQLQPHRSHFLASPCVQFFYATRSIGIVNMGAGACMVRVVRFMSAVPPMRRMRITNRSSTRIYPRLIPSRFDRFRQLAWIRLCGFDLDLRAPHHEINLRIKNPGLRTQHARHTRRAARAGHAINFQFTHFGSNNRRTFCGMCRALFSHFFDPCSLQICC